MSGCEVEQLRLSRHVDTAGDGSAFAVSFGDSICCILQKLLKNSKFIAVLYLIVNNRSNITIL